MVITFNLEKRIDVAFQEVQAKVNQVVRRLPKDADPPVVAKVETNTQAILQIALQGDRTQQQLNLYAINVIKKQLETIDGVGEVRIGGRRDRNIRINLLPAKMAAYAIAAQDITDAFGREHLQLAGGFLVGRSTEHLVKIDLEFHKLDDLAAMIVGYKDGAPVRLRDIAEIEDGLTDNRQLARLNGKPAVGIGIVKVPNTNTVEIIDRVLERIERDVRPQLPPGLELHIVQSDKIFIGAMVDALKSAPGRGHHPRRAHRVAVPEELPLDGDRRLLDPGIADGRDRGDVLLRLHLQLGNAARAAAAGGRGGRRRHRGAGEHLPPPRRGPRHDRDGRGGHRQPRGDLRGDRGELLAGGHLRPGGVRQRHPRPVSALVRRGRHLRRAGVAVRLAHAHADAVLALSRRAGEAWSGVLGARALLRAASTACTAACSALRCATARLVLVAAVLAFALAIPMFQGLPRELAPQADEGRFLVGIRTPLGSSIDYTEGKLREVEAIA